MRPWPRRARPSTAAVYSTELQEISGIEGDGAILRAPVQVGSGHASRRAHAADELAALDGITGGDQRATQMMVDGHQAVAVMQEDGGAAVEEIADQRHDAAIRRAHRRALRAGEEIGRASCRE